MILVSSPVAITHPMHFAAAACWTNTGKGADILGTLGSGKKKQGNLERIVLIG